MLIHKHLMRFTDKKSVPAVSHSEMRNLSPRLIKRYVVRRNNYEGIFRNVIKDGVETGEFRNIDVNLTAASIRGLLNSVTLWYRSEGHYAMEDISTRIIDTLYSGIKA